MSNSRETPDSPVSFVIGTTKEGRVLIQFVDTDAQGHAIIPANGVVTSRPVDHLKLRVSMALEMADALREAAQSARSGRIILTHGRNDG